MAGRLLYYVVPAAALAVAAMGCDGKPPPPTHRVMSGQVSGDLITGTPVTAAPATAATAAPTVPDPPPVNPGPGASETATPGAAGAPAVVDPGPKDPNPEGADPKNPAAAAAAEAPVPPPLDGLPQPPKLPAAEKRKGYTSTSFDILSGYEPGPLGVFGASPKILKNIKISQFVPKHVMDMNDTKVGITGYMIPVDFDKNEVLTFLLCRWQPGCCFGHVPKAHEQIYVEVKPGSGCRFVIVPVTAYGKLTVGPKKNADGTIVEDGGETMSLYRLLADKVDVPKDW